MSKKQKELWGTPLNGSAADSKSFGGTGGRCYETHPPLPIRVKKDGQDVEYQIYGGNCGNPVHLDCHVYVALQSGSAVQLPHPWESGYGEIVQVRYSIRDMEAPSNPQSFKAMIDWLCNQLHEGKKIHIGCIGGHGRTGTVFAAVVAKMMPEEPDAIEYVRKNYCERAVESSEQVKFLVKHFGVKEHQGAKSWGGGGKHSGGVIEWGGKSYSKGSPISSGGAYEFPKKTTRFAGAKRTIDPVPSRRNIFAAYA